MVAARARVPAAQAALVAVSGIDGSGKGFVSAGLAAALRQRGLGVASFNVDGWLNLPQVRFSPTNTAEHFYRHAIRFEALFAELVTPLVRARRIRLEADFAAETATSFVKRRYAFDDVDVVLVEGIYLIQAPYRQQYDLSVWIECSFDTALQRALARGQEGLDTAATRHAYRTIYFPAQEIHFARDQPQRHATLRCINDPRLEA